MIRHATRALLLGALVLASLGLFACYPGDGPTAQETDVVVTQYNGDARFGQYATFALADSVYHLTDATEDLCGDRSHDALILGRVAANLQALGFTRLDTSQVDLADLAVVVSLACSRTVVIGTRPPYWGGWPGYPCCWYPGYPPYYVAGSYSTGTIFVDAFDDGLLDPDSEELPSAWSAAINGVITTSGLTSRITDAIDQAFEQSPYLAPAN